MRRAGSTSWAPSVDRLMNAHKRPTAPPVAPGTPRAGTDAEPTPRIVRLTIDGPTRVLVCRTVYRLPADVKVAHADNGLVYALVGDAVHVLCASGEVVGLSAAILDALRTEHFGASP